MLECEWKPSDFSEIETFPQADGSVVRGNHEVELHCTEALLSRVIQGVSTHRTGDAFPCSRGQGHIPGIGHMAPATKLIGANIVGAEDQIILLGHERFPVRPHPIFERRPFAHISGKSIGFP